MFNEANTVEAYVRDLLAGPVKAVPASSFPEGYERNLLLLLEH